MGRLIDTDMTKLMVSELLEVAQKENFTAEDVIDHMYEWIDNIPTAYNIEKVVEDVTEKAERYCNSVSCEDNPRGLTHLCADCEHYCLTKGIIEVIRKGGVNG